MEIENFARLVLFSNHGAPINIEEGDRRYFVFKSNAQPRDDGYYEQLYEFIEGRDGMDAVYTFFASATCPASMRSDDQRLCNSVPGRRS